MSPTRKPAGGRTRFWPVLSILALSLPGCAGAGSDRYLCPPLIDHSVESQSALADELEAAPAGAVWPGYIYAYLQHRDACRALQPE